MKKKQLLSTLVFILSTTIIHSQFNAILNFAGISNGAEPSGTLISDGTYMYGMTRTGGSNDMGTIFKILPNGTGYVKLFDFTGTSSGSLPMGSLVSDGIDLYGMTEFGGVNNQGVIFKISVNGNGFTKLKDFSMGLYGRRPFGSLFYDGSYLYGMTWLGGTNEMGVVFKILPDGSNYTILIDFANSTIGRAPLGNLISDGTFLYGMTTSGGIFDAGTIFKILPDGNGFIKIFDFPVGSTGYYPFGSLFFDGTFLYGMTNLEGLNNKGTIFKILPNGSGYNVLHNFGCGDDGAHPNFTTLISDGNFLYGMTSLGGINNEGTIFKIMHNGLNYEKIFDFNSVPNGGYPDGSLIIEGNNLYGMTWIGGTNNLGTIFKYNIPQTDFNLKYCEGDIIQLDSPDGVSHLWTGPNSFSSTIQNPVLPSSFSNMQGTYSVQITDSFGCLSSSSIQITINTIPTGIISGPQYLCEMNPNAITITSPNNLQNISWSTSPTNIFLGQGTNQITPLSWPQYQNDISVMVTAIDSNGCTYAAQTTLFACCLADTSGTEFFERVYTQTGLNSMSAQLPNGYYNGPAQQIIIDLPPQPPLNMQISTIYSNATSITQFIAQNPTIYNSGSATISTSNWIFFNNDLIIDQSVTFDLCDFIRFAPGAKIIVQSNQTLSITRSTLAPKCREMWGGIEMDNNTEIILLRDANIIGAKTGLTSSHGGYYQITSSKFIDNLVGIKVENYTTIPTTSSIIGSYFGDVIGQPLLPPYQTEPQPLVGILVDDIKDITIGTPDNLVEGNLFHHHQRGIQCTRSNLKSFRNNFHNIKKAGSGPSINQGDKFAAIFATNTLSFPGGLANHTLWVGDNLADLRNNFLNCEFGISSRKNMNLDVRNNFMKNCLIRGISAEDNPFKKIDILTNEINSISSNAWAIYVKNYSYGTATVLYNKINTTSSNLPVFTRFSAGIYISSVNPTVSQTTTVYSNTINNCLYGIWMINTTNGLLESNTININLTNFMINSLSNNFAPIRGIVVQNSNKARIRRNIITRNYGNGIGVINNNLQGIRLELSPASEVWENRMYNTAVGFYAYGSSLGSRVECNQMHYTRNGFYLQQADLSNQGAPAVAPYPNGYDAHNQWYNTFSSRTDGTMPNGIIRKYYHGINPELNSGPSPTLSLISWQDMTLSSLNPFTTCIQAKNPLVNIETPASKRERELLPIAQNNIQYDTLDYQQKHFLNLAAFARLESDSSLLIMNIPEDSIFINYVEQNVNLNSQSKIIHDAQKSMATFDFLVSQNACNQISNCTVYNTNKMVQELWIQRKMDDTNFTSTDTLFLMSIACSDPLEFGSGVYQARAMIDWDGLCNYQSKSVNLENNEYNKIAQFSKIYPNPSDGKFQLEADSPIKKVIVVDLNGIELRNFTNNYSEIDTKLSTGVYVVQIILENGITETHKIYIR
jgi:uncharacterized repeat protein (TIGR03803 family)